jgi:hypothetical protein
MQHMAYTTTKTTDTDNLERIKRNVSDSCKYFKENVKRWRDYRTYVFRSSLNEMQRNLLQQNARPITEFNILEAYISRLLGEFAKHEPSIEITPSEGLPIPAETLDAVEGHLRHIIYESNKDSFAYEIYKDLLSGGYSVAKVWTDYQSPMSFNQQIFLSRVFDPTMAGFDPMARAPHKGDGKYSFEIYPMLEEDFKLEFPSVDMSKFKFTMVSQGGGIEGFSWSYKDLQNRKCILVADYYEKKRKKARIVQLANGRVLTTKDYEKLQEYWQENQFIEQIPAVIGEPRSTILERVCRYRIVECEILDYLETDYCYLPHVFFDGNSIMLTQGTSNTQFQMTRPYVYHAKGVQDMTNFAGQTICNAMENLIQHKFIVMKEAIPQEKDYLEALNNIQKANTIVVNAYSEQNPDQPIPNPIREVQNVPLPPEVTAAFQMTAPMTQTILGSYASNLGKNDNDLSGKAIIESSSVGNAAAMPYIVGYLAGLTQIGVICVDLMPKYLKGKRTIPVVSKDGDKNHQGINQPQMPYLDYQENAIHVNISAGVNFQVQKTQSMATIVSLMQASQEFAEFMNSPAGLPILLDNIECYGSDRLREASTQWMQQKQQQQAQMQQMQQQAQQSDPAFILAQAEMMKVQNTAEKDKVDEQLKIARLAIDKEKADADILLAEARVNQAQIDSAVKLEESNTSLHRHALDSATKLAEIQSREHRDHLATHELHHQIQQAQQKIKE